MTSLVLASSSPRRRVLLSRTGFGFAVHNPTVDEAVRGDEPPAAYARRMAVDKASAVRSSLAEEAVIVAADTVVVATDRILGKPACREEARHMLEGLSDRWHVVISAWCVVGPGETPRAEIAETRVRFKSLSAPEVGWYLDTGEWRDKAGAYGIQGRGAFLVAAVEGSYTNVVGLPLAAVVDALAARSIWPAPLSPAAGETEIIG